MPRDLEPSDELPAGAIPLDDWRPSRSFAPATELPGGAITLKDWRPSKSFRAASGDEGNLPSPPREKPAFAPAPADEPIAPVAGAPEGYRPLRPTRDDKGGEAGDVAK